MSNTVREFFGHREPKPFVMKAADPTRGTNPNLWMGVELEVEGCDLDLDSYITLVNKYGWAVTVDESLRGNNLRRTGNQIEGNAFEFISKPMAQHGLMMSLEEFFKVTKFDESNYSDRTSVHVHVNCLDLTFDQLSAVSLLYTVVEEIMFKFIGNNRENNIYCIPWSGCRMNHDMIDKLENEGSTAIKRWAKYTALNLLPLATQGTVEFRHMHGNADVAYIQKWLNIIGALFRYGTQRQLTDVVEEIKALNNTSEYEVFFNQVFAGLLPYDDSYREALEAGVIVAKFGLINWKKKEKINFNGGMKIVQPVYPDEIDILDDPETAQHNPAPVARPVERVNPNRFDPWPRTGRFYSLAGAAAPNLAELRTLGNHASLYTTIDSILTITGQPRTIQPTVRVAATAREWLVDTAQATAVANPYGALFNEAPVVVNRNR